MSDGDDSESAMKWVAIIVAIVVAVPFTAIMATQAPWVLALLVTLGFLAWAGVRSGVLADDDEETATEADPLATLQERYAAGELSEAEFERRLDRILESDELVARAEGGGSSRADGVRGGRERDERRSDRGGASRRREPATERE